MNPDGEGPRPLTARIEGDAGGGEEAIGWAGDDPYEDGEGDDLGEWGSASWRGSGC